MKCAAVVLRHEAELVFAVNTAVAMALSSLPEADKAIVRPVDDGEYKLSLVSQNHSCTLHLDGPSDPETGLQYSREISIGGDSPQISFML